VDYFMKSGVTIGAIDRTVVISSTGDILDLIAEASYLEHAQCILIYKESLPDRFFDLKTGFAGEVLQKFSNYSMKLAVVGDFSGYTSRSLKDFIRESNRGKQVYFKPDLDSALDALTAHS
jgi:hypothetical protein